ncbi:MAG: cytochrome c oxidase assembly protein, partial [Burkholderiales bacterium]
PKDVTTITLSYTFFEVGGKIPAAPAGGPVASQQTGQLPGAV